MPRISGHFYFTQLLTTTQQHNERRNQTRMWNCTFEIKETVRILQREIRFCFLWNTKNVSPHGKAA